ncbi:ABC transporter substrate-binding protein [Corynebacterium sp. TAE3-ERU12]|uniref:peptide ABC transporter substrate-binding protein n=1 Tax=Corynebacterium sp. TAE3-ERU12 TaxID=2849491 RepID=UPI002102EBFB|nr:ABC transporter substrate-binding protein [Corynebacterium sp. TAE3-ERU12]
MALTACSTNQQNVAEGVIVAYGSEPQNPLVTTNTNETGGGEILKTLYSGLVRYKADGEIVNDHAESIEANDDSTEFRIKLKPGWTFTNGEPVTAQSYVDAWNFGAYGPNAQFQQSFFDIIKGFDEVSAVDATDSTMSGLKVINDREFVVQLSRPESTFPLRLGHSTYMPLPKVAFEDIEAFGEHPIGNGPYKLIDGKAWLHNNSLTVTRNDDYAGEVKAQNNGVKFQFYSDLDTAYADLLSGRLDTIGNTVSPNALASFQTDFPESSQNDPTASNQAFIIPEWLPHFSGEEGRLRRAAISQSFDRDLITEKIFFGTRTPAVEFTALTLGDVETDIPGKEVLTYNPKRAKELWEQANEIAPWEGDFIIAYNADGGHQTWVEAVTNMIGATLGIESHGKAYPTFKQLRDEVTNETITTAFRSGWLGDWPSVNNFLDPLYSSNGASNDGNYQNEEFDQLLQDAAAAPNEKEAAEIYRQAQAILMRDLPAIPLWYPNASTAWNPEVGGVEIRWDGYPSYQKITKD